MISMIVTSYTSTQGSHPVSSNKIGNEKENIKNFLLVERGASRRARGRKVGRVRDGGGEIERESESE